MNIAYMAANNPVTFAAGSGIGTAVCITITALAVNGNQANTITLVTSSDYAVDGNGNGFASFVELTIVESNTGKRLYTIVINPRRANAGGLR